MPEFKRFDFSEEYSRLRSDVFHESILRPLISVKELEQECNGNEDLAELLRSMLNQCALYTEDVARFLQVQAKGSEAKESGEYHEMGLQRKLTHNATIDSINILARELNRCGRDGSWIKKFANNRAAYMQFALALTFDRMLEKG